MSSKERILNNLKTNSRPFPNAEARPASYRSVTALSDANQIARFTAEVERLTGKVYPVQSSDEVFSTLIGIIGTDKRVLAWKTLPLPKLADQLRAEGVEIVTPTLQDDQRGATLADMETVRVGVTGADAAFATTGTLALVTTPEQARLPSLLPVVHVALLSKDKLYDTLEAWMQTEGRAAMLTSRSIAFVTGPSRTSDIEMQLILGVHGPRDLHVIIY